MPRSGWTGKHASENPPPARRHDMREGKRRCLRRGRGGGGEGITVSFDGRGSNGFLPLKGNNSKTSCHIFLTQYSKRHCNNFNGGHLRF